MGNTGSRTSITTTSIAEATSQVVMDSTASCVQSSSFGQSMTNIARNGSKISGNSQSMTGSYDATCVQQNTQDASAIAKISAQVAQEMSKQGVAGTQWLNADKTDMSVYMSSKIASSMNLSNTQSCIAGLVAKQDMTNIALDGSVISGNSQTMSVSGVSSCLLGSSLSAKNMADIANSANQHAAIKDENATAPLFDAIRDIVKAPLAAMSGVFIAVILIAMVIMAVIYFRSGGSGMPSIPSMPNMEDMQGMMTKNEVAPASL